MEINFKDKVVLITGAGSGMGLLSAKCFARDGAKVVLVDINEAAVNEAAAEIRALGGEALALKANVMNYGEVKESCDKASEVFGGIDILCTFAGGAETRLLKTASSRFHEIPIEVFDFGIDLNLKGAVYFCHAAFPHMIKRGGGVIVTLGSITGEEGGEGCVAYSASKSALMNGVVKSLALSGEAYGIRAVCVAPGPVLTRPGMAGMKTMAGRAAEPQEIVDMILYVASDKGAFINGTTILIDGGRNVLFNKNGGNPVRS